MLATFLPMYSYTKRSLLQLGAWPYSCVQYWPMSIFPRRVVQGLIDGSPGYLRTSQIRNLINRLNSLADPNDALAAEWELVVLSTFHGIGPIQYEPRGTGT